MLNTQVCTLFGAAAAAAAAVTRMPNLIGFSRRKSRLSSPLTNCMHPLLLCGLHCLLLLHILRFHEIKELYLNHKERVLRFAK